MAHPAHYHVSPSTTTLRALAVGDRSSRELADALAVLERAVPTRFLSTLPEAVACYSADAAPPDLLVLLQTHSGQFLERDLLRLRRCMPLAKAVAVLGSWCEGEMRSGRPLAAVRRVAWHAWPYRLQRELVAWPSGIGGTWSLPATASEEELLLEADAVRQWPRSRDPLRPIAIRTQDPDLAACLVEALACHGRSGVRLLSGRPAEMESFSALVDELSLPADCERLSPDYGAWHPRPILVLADFPRPQDERLARQAGATLLLAKPLDLDELAAHVDRVLGSVGRRPE